MKYFQHSHAIVETDNIGENTKLWAFVHVLSGAQIGTDCNICDHVFIENDVKIGNRVTIKSGVQVWDGVTLEDDVFVGPNTTFTNDLFPRSKHYPEKFEKTLVRKGASLGANSTILAGNVIGRNAMVGAGSVVTRDVPPNTIVVGNPAIIKGYVDSKETTQLHEHAEPLKEPGERRLSRVSDVRIYKMPFIQDMRGSLTVAEYGQHLPFIPKRYFRVFLIFAKRR
jgi:acetyltransferase-like isoleucine patch superfamily enzyme